MADLLKLADYCRGQFNPEMMGEEIDENTRSIFPVEPNDDIVLADTKEWVQRGDCMNLNLKSAKWPALLLVLISCGEVSARLSSASKFKL